MTAAAEGRVIFGSGATSSVLLEQPRSRPQGGHDAQGPVQVRERRESAMRIADKAGELSFNVLEAEAPVLLGMDFLRKALATLDFESGVMRAPPPISPHDIPLERLSSGHLALRVAGAAA